MDQPVSNREFDRSDFWRFTVELIKTAIVVSILAYTIRAFILQPFIVEGRSMFPQFHDHDYLLVDKLSYRFHQPDRGDIVVFKFPKDISFNYVKRIIGLPGERVKIENSSVTVYNKEHPDGLVLTEPYVSADNKTLVNPELSGNEFTVPEDSYFVLGDNRMGSSDSREWGMLPSADMIGRVIVQVYPLDRFQVYPHATYP